MDGMQSVEAGVDSREQIGVGTTLGGDKSLDLVRGQLESGVEDLFGAAGAWIGPAIVRNQRRMTMRRVAARSRQVKRAR